MTRSLIDQVRSRPRLYVAAKRLQPLYFRWLGLRGLATRALLATPGMNRVFQNPLRTAIASVVASDFSNAERVGLRAISLQPNVKARRTLPPGLDSRYEAIFARLQNAESGPGTVYILRDGCVWGPDGAVMSRDRSLIGDLSPVIRLPPDSHPMFRRPIFSRPKPLLGCLGAATGPSPNNVSHWILGVLPRISLLKQWDPTFEKIDWILAPSRTAFQVECLRRFGVPRAKVIEAGHDTFFEAQEVVAASFFNWTFGAPSWLLADVRERFDDVPPAPRVRRLYISRRGAPGRRVRNEDEVTALLSSLAFQTVQLEHLPFLEQVALFKGAETIVAPHGAGLAHLVFAGEGTAVVELFSPSYVNPMYWCLADELRLRYRCCIGTQSDARDENDLVRDDLTVDIGALASTVKSLIAA